MDPLKPKKTKLSNVALVALVSFVILNLLLGALGGVAGFVFLTNNNSKFATLVRDQLGLEDSSVTIPVRQSLKLEESSAVIDAAKKVSDAVVSVTANRQVSDFFGRLSDQEIGAGTGFILTSDGLIATNKHVVSENADYQVVLNDGRTLPAKVQAIDQFNDFAVLKVEATDLPTVEIGSSDELQIGQYVIAVGNALGEFNNSVTLGIVSAKERTLNASSTGGATSETLTGLIQTDAAVNSGNSGGPLVNMKGQVVGINTAIASTTGGSIGLSFAIPVDSLRTVIDSVRKTGKIIRPYLGVRYIPVTKSVQQQNNLSVDYGALISRGQTETELAILSGSPAEKAGLQENDIITEVNGDRVDAGSPLTKRLQKYNVGDKITLSVLRKGETLKIDVTLEALENS